MFNITLESFIFEDEDDYHFAKASGIVTKDRRKNWPIADRRFPSNHPRNNCGMHFGPSSLLVSKAAIDQGPVVQRPISTNPGLNFNPGFFFFCFKAFSRIIFPFFLEHPITELQTRSIKLNLLFKLLYLNSNFALTLGYFNPALNNSARVFL